MSSKNKNKKSLPIQSPLSNSRYNKPVFYILTAIILTTLLIYFKAIKFEFIYNWDDQDYIIDNADIKSLTWSNIKLFFGGFYNSNYQPVTMLFYAVLYKFGHGTSGVFHFFNILVHLLNTFLVFKLIQAISPKNAIVPLTTAALFAIHPMHVESVVWISELKDVLYSFFFLMALIVYTQFLKTEKLKDIGFVMCLFLLACLSKSAAVILLVVLVLFDFYFNNKLVWKTVLEKIPFFVVSLIFGIIAIRSQAGAIQEMAPDMSAINHIAIVSFSFCSYLVKAVLPFKQSALYPYPTELQSNLPVFYYLSVLLLILIFVAVWFSQKWGKEILFGFLFFVINVLLVIQFLPVGAAVMADRYSYIPYIGLFFIVGHFLNYMLARYSNSKNVVYFVLVLCFVGLCKLTYARINVWKDDNTLFTDVIDNYNYCSIAYLNRGTYLYNNLSVTDTANKDNYIKRAIADFESALKYPLSDVNKARACLALGKTNSALNNNEQAVLYLNKSIETNSTFWANAYIERGGIYLNHYAEKVFFNDTLKRNDYLRKAIADYKWSLRLTKKDELRSILYYNIGIAQAGLGNAKAAILNVDSAIQLNPYNIDAYFNRCSYKISTGDNNGAIEDCNSVIKIAPQNAKAYFNKAFIKYNIGDFKGAIDDLTVVLSLEPNNSLAYTLRANSYTTIKNYTNALADYNKAIAVNPNDRVAIGNRDRVILLDK